MKLYGLSSYLGKRIRWAEPWRLEVEFSSSEEQAGIDGSKD